MCLRGGVTSSEPIHLYKMSLIFACNYAYVLTYILTYMSTYARHFYMHATFHEECKLAGMHGCECARMIKSLHAQKHQLIRRPLGGFDSGMKRDFGEEDPKEGSPVVGHTGE